ncbi:MAG TPA: hypothetical protein VK151_01625 [Fluviicola sp.]|nr:hypothetical protein [Fluviicola sp.]
MNKAFYIASIVLSVAFLIVVGVYIDMVESERLSYFLNSYDSYSPYSSYSSMYTYDYSSEYTFEGALISLLFILFFLTTDLLGLMKVKTKTTKVLSIIGLSLGGIFLFVDVIMILSPDSSSFDEGGGGLLFYGLIVLAFSIVGLIQSVRYGNQKKSVKNPSNDLLDS